jgi:leader peptidase (prepilin peptidase)/N-methyltransferase
MLYAIIVLFGLVVGSFLNVLIDRIPRGENVVWKPSHCDYCKKPLRWFELFPVISYVIQGGRCRRCRHTLSIQYPALESITAFGFLGVFLYTNTSVFWLLLSLCIFSSLLVIFMIDMKHQIIPDSILLVLLIGIAVSGIPLSWAQRGQHLMTALICGGLFLFLWTVTRGRGLGFGDVKLVAVLTLFLGYPFSVIMLYIAFLTGAMLGVILIATHRAKMKTRIAFGPFLIAGFAGAILFGESILVWWRSLL